MSLLTELGIIFVCVLQRCRTYGALLLRQTIEGSGNIMLVSDACQDSLTDPIFPIFPWNNPTLAGRYLLVRNSEEVACYELPVEGAMEK